jgi:hypothetical protein
MFRSILIIFRELLNVNKAYVNIDGIWKPLKFVHNIFVDNIKFVCSSAVVVRKIRKV